MILLESNPAERGLIASILLDPSTIPDVESIVNPDDLIGPGRSRLVAMIFDMHRAGESLRDPHMLWTRIMSSGLLEELGGTVQFREDYMLQDTEPNAAVYARQVRSHSLNRQAVALVSEAESRLTTSDDVSKTVRWLRDQLSAIESMVDAQSDFSLGQACDKVIASIETSRSLGKSHGVPTGVDWFDNSHGGLQPGRLYVIAARPGVGKTSLAQQMGEEIAANGEGVFMVSLEMSDEELAGRFLSRKTGINGKFINGHAVNKDDIAEMKVAAKEAHSLPFTISVPNGRRKTVSAICANVRLKKTTHDISAVVIDYLQIIDGESSQQREYDRLTEATKKFKELSRELKIPVILLSQVGRAYETRDTEAPKLSDLKGTGSIEQDADAVLFLHRLDDPTKAQLTVAKIRGGETGFTVLDFDGPRCAFRNPARS